MTEPATGAASGPPPDPAPTAGGQAIAFAVLAALAAAVLVTSFGYGILDEQGRVGPGLLPMVTGLLMLALSSAQLFVRLRRLRGGAPRAADRAGVGADVDVFGRTQAQRVRQLRIVVLALPAAVLLVPLLGFLGAFGLLLLFIAVVVERRRLPAALLVTALAVAAGYGVFAEFLNVPLPTGALGDLFGR